jgi:hypothetical protein
MVAKYGVQKVLGKLIHKDAGYCAPDAAASGGKE